MPACSSRYREYTKVLVSVFVHRPRLRSGFLLLNSSLESRSRPASLVTQAFIVHEGAKSSATLTWEHGNSRIHQRISLILVSSSWGPVHQRCLLMGPVTPDMVTTLSRQLSQWPQRPQAPGRCLTFLQTHFEASW